MDLIKNYLIDKALVLIPCLIILGTIIKNTPKVPNWIIPYALLIFGVAGCLWLVGFSIEGVVQGVLVTGAAVFGNQLFSCAVTATTCNKKTDEDTKSDNTDNNGNGEDGK